MKTEPKKTIDVDAVMAEIMASAAQYPQKAKEEPAKVILHEIPSKVPPKEKQFLELDKILATEVSPDAYTDFARKPEIKKEPPKEEKIIPVEPPKPKPIAIVPVKEPTRKISKFTPRPPRTPKTSIPKPQKRKSTAKSPKVGVPETTVSEEDKVDPFKI